MHHNNSGEILSKFCSFHFFLILIQFEKNGFEISNFVRFVG